MTNFKLKFATLLLSIGVFQLLKSHCVFVCVYVCCHHLITSTHRHDYCFLRLTTHEIASRIRGNCISGDVIHKERNHPLDGYLFFLLSLFSLFLVFRSFLNLVSLLFFSFPRFLITIISVFVQHSWTVSSY